MVRSNSERESAAELASSLQLVPQIRSAEKWFDASVGSIERELDAVGGKSEWRSELDVAEMGARVSVKVRLNLNCKAPNPVGWTASIKVGGLRVDGIDHEGGRGWHRHYWDATAQNCKEDKRPVTGFSEKMRRSEFIVRVLAEMKVRLNKHDNGRNAELPYD